MFAAILDVGRGDVAASDATCAGHCAELMSWVQTAYLIAGHHFSMTVLARLLGAACFVIARRCSR
jgi:hypothetical protein